MTEQLLGFDVDVWKVIGMTVGTAVAAIIGRRKLKMMASLDSVQVEAHVATKSVYQTLRDENDRLRSIIEQKDATIRELTERSDRAFQERNSALLELAGLRTEARLLREHSGSLELKILEMQRRIENLLKKGE